MCFGKTLDWHSNNKQEQLHDLFSICSSPIYVSFSKVQVQRSMIDTA